LGAGGVAGCAALAAGVGLARTGITDPSLALFVAGYCVSPPPMSQDFLENLGESFLYFCIVSQTIFASLNAKTNPVPKFIDPVFAKTGPKRSFSLTENERFWLVFAKTGSII
jgi:hypothetical protein